MNKNIIIGLLVVVIIAIGGIFALTHTNNNKINTEVEFLSNTTLSNGDNVEVLLKDVNGNPLAEQNITIMYEEEGNTQEYYVITDSEGKAYLALTDEPSGAHTVTIKYDGNEKYNPCTAKETITINENGSTNQSTATTQSTATNSTATASTVKYNNKTTSTAKTTQKTNTTKNNKNSYSSNKTKYDPEKAFTTLLYYDSKLDVYYDDFGNIHGGPHDGQDISDLRGK